MGISTVNLVKNFIIPFNPNDGENIKLIYENNLNQSELELDEEIKIISMSAYLKSFKAYSNIKSLPVALLPEYTPGESDTERLKKALQAEWNCQRFHLALYYKLANTNWYQIGEISLSNKENYPFEVHSLMDIFTDGLAQELGKNTSIGASLVDVNYGIIQSQDILNIHGTINKEFVLYTKEIIIVGGEEMASTFDASAIISGIINSARLPIGDTVQAYNDRLAIISGYTGTSKASIPCFIGSSMLIKELELIDLPAPLNSFSSLVNSNQDEVVIWNGSTFSTRKLTSDDMPEESGGGTIGTGISDFYDASMPVIANGTPDNIVSVSYFDDLLFRRILFVASKGGKTRYLNTTTATCEGSPYSLITPDHVGQVVIDTVAEEAYMAMNRFATGWKKITVS